MERARGCLQKDILGAVVDLKPLYYSAAPIIIIIIITAIVTVEMEVSDVQVIKLVLMHTLLEVHVSVQYNMCPFRELQQ